MILSKFGSTCDETKFRCILNFRRSSLWVTISAVGIITMNKMSIKWITNSTSMTFQWTLCGWTLNTPTLKSKKFSVASMDWLFSSGFLVHLQILHLGSTQVRQFPGYDQEFNSKGTSSYCHHWSSHQTWQQLFLPQRLYRPRLLCQEQRW